MPASEKTFVVDQGLAWTKGFLFSSELEVLKKSLCPTTPDPKDGVDWVLASLGQAKERVILLNDREKENYANSLLKLFSNFYGKKFIRLDFGASLYKKNIPAEKILPYLRQATQISDIENYLGNKRIKNWRIPHNQKEFEIELSYLLNSLPFEEKKPLGVILSGGIFRNKIGPYEILMTLNLLKPSPLTEIFVDKENISLAWGACLKEAALEDKSELKLGGIEKLGTLISLNGEGKVAFDFGLKELQETEVGKDEIIVIPCQSDQKVKATFNKDGVEIKESIITGGLGIIIDRRDNLSFADKSRTSKWLAYLGGLSIIE